jgi:thioredoxin-like negative regulator of GroEL
MILYKFYSPSCQPCKVLTNILNSLPNNPDISLVPIDVTDPENFFLVQSYSVQRVPTLAFSKDKSIEGLRSAKFLERWINSYGEQE